MPAKSGTASAPRAAVVTTPAASAAVTSTRKSRLGVFMISSLTVRLQMKSYQALRAVKGVSRPTGASRHEAVNGRVL
jgi:hypothetical protein